MEGVRGTKKCICEESRESKEAQVERKSRKNSMERSGSLMAIVAEAKERIYDGSFRRINAKRHVPNESFETIRGKRHVLKRSVR